MASDCISWDAGANKYILKVLILSIMALLLAGLVSGLEQWCYQEFADSPAECGNNGSYSLRSISNHGYFYINYTKPVNATIDSLWVVKIGTLGNDSHQLPSDCWAQDPLRFEIHSSTQYVGTNASCWNGSSWVTITADYLGGAPFSFEGTVNITRQKDGLYNTYILFEHSTDTWKWAGLSYYEPARIYEEAMNWQTGCVNDYVCVGYGSCNTSDLAPCNNVTDNSICNETYSGDYSEFTPQACNYCASDVIYTAETGCHAVTNLKTVYYTDNNFETCCNITGLPSDCPQNESLVGIETSCSFFNYDEDDIGEGAFDTAVKLAIVIARFSGLIVLGLLVVVGVNFIQKMFVRKRK